MTFVLIRIFLLNDWHYYPSLSLSQTEGLFLFSIQRKKT